MDVRGRGLRTGVPARGHSRERRVRGSSRRDSNVGAANRTWEWSEHWLAHSFPVRRHGLKSLDLRIGLAPLLFLLGPPPTSGLPSWGVRLLLSHDPGRIQYLSPQERVAIQVEVGERIITTVHPEVEVCGPENIIITL